MEISPDPKPGAVNPSPSAKLLEAYRAGLHTLLCYGRISINEARRRLAEFESLGEGEGKRALRRLLALRDHYRWADARTKAVITSCISCPQRE